MPLGQASHTAKRKWLEPLPTIGRMRLALSAISIALTIAGCSSYATPDKSASIEDKSIRDSSTARRTAVANPPSGTHGSHRALVAARSAPNCELAGPDSDTIDPDLWARLKLDYERQCYKQAEMLARKRLRQLLASGQCGDTASSRSPAFRHNYATVR
jgi:hypothetical protein